MLNSLTDGIRLSGDTWKTLPDRFTESNQKGVSTIMEIERKFLIRDIPGSLENYRCLQIEQAYLCTNPVVRVRRQDDEFILTWKGEGMMTREEYNLPLTRDGYFHLLAKADGNILTKKRYLIPLSSGLKAELDIFEGKFEGLRLVEVEFPDEQTANHFTAPDWFGTEVTHSGAYHNSVLSTLDSFHPETYPDPE